MLNVYVLQLRRKPACNLWKIFITFFKSIIITMYPRVSRDEQYFSNLNGKRPPVPGKEDDFDLQHILQENRKSTVAVKQQRAELGNCIPSQSFKFINGNPSTAIQSLHVTHSKHSNVKPVDLNKKSKKFGTTMEPSERENGVGETCDETRKVINHERSLSNPTSAQERTVFFNSAYLHDHPRCCGEDEVVCFENCITPSKSNSPTTCLRWTEGLNALLNDAEGLDLFRRFLESELSESSKVLDFVFSCRGLQLMNESKRGKLIEVARLIHKRYILKEAGLRLDPEVKRTVTERIKQILESPNVESNHHEFSIKDIFTEALRQAEKFLEKEVYPLFLKSDEFLNYFQRETEMMFTNNNNDNQQINNNCSPQLKKESGLEENVTSLSQNPLCAPVDDGNEKDGEWLEGGRRKPPPSPKTEESNPGVYGSVLPSLPEEKELKLNYKPKPEDSSIGQLPGSGEAPSVPVLQLSPLSLIATRKTRQKHLGVVPSSSTPYIDSCGPSMSGKLSNPYHVSYAPGSAQDSELQSLSSDALTEDTMSFTDSSLDGRLDMVTSRPFSVAAYKKHIRYVKNFAAKNHEANFPGRFIPRTDRVPPDSNLATANPQAFATMLIGKLQVVKENQEKMERIVRIMQGLQSVEKDSSVPHTHHHHHHHHHQQRSHGKSKSKQNHSHHTGKHSITSVPSEEIGFCTGDESEDPDNAQSILDDHVSQLWNSFGNSPNHFSSGLATPEGPKLKGDVRGNHSLHYGHCSSVNPCSSFSNFNQWRCDVTNFQKISLYCHVPDIASVNSSLDFDKKSIATSKTHVHPTHNASVSFAPLGHGASSHNSSQKNRACIEKCSSRLSAMSNCQAPITSNARDFNQLLYKTPGEQNGTSLSYVGHPSSCHQSNPSNIIGQTRNKHQYSLSDCKASNAVIKEDQERSLNLKIQSSHSASNRHLQSSHKKQLSFMNSFDLTSPESIFSVKTRWPDKKPEFSKGFEHSLPNTKLASIIKTSPSSTECIEIHNVKGQVPRSKSLDRHKVFSTNGNSSFSHAHQNSAFLECKPSGTKPDSHGKAKESIISPRPHHLPGLSNKIKCSMGTSTHQNHSLGGMSPLSQSTKKTEILQESTVVGYYMQNELIPYRITLPGRNITLGQLKMAISKKDNYRFFFKKLCSDFDTEVVHEEVCSDNQVLPLWEGKVVCRIEKIG